MDAIMAAFAVLMSKITDPALVVCILIIGFLGWLLVQFRNDLREARKDFLETAKQANDAMTKIANGLVELRVTLAGLKGNNENN